MRGAVVSDVIQAWIEHLLIHQTGPRTRIAGSAERYKEWYGAEGTPRGQHDFRSSKARVQRYPLPEQLAFITCQAQACVLAKGCAEHEAS